MHCYSQPLLWNGYIHTNTATSHKPIMRAPTYGRCNISWRRLPHIYCFVFCISFSISWIVHTCENNTNVSMGACISLHMEIILTCSFQLFDRPRFDLANQNIVKIKIKTFRSIIDPLHKWRLNLNNNTWYILSLTLMFQDKGIFTWMWG